MPALWAAGISAVAGLAGGAMQRKSANNQAKAQMEWRNRMLSQSAPWIDEGKTALSDYHNQRDYFSHQFNQGDLMSNLSPSYGFELAQGQGAAANALNASGGAGGNFAAGLSKYTQGMASTGYQQAFENYQSQRQGIFSRLMDVAGMGQNALSSVQGHANTATGRSSDYATSGAAAMAGGLVGAGNAISQGYQNQQGWNYLNNIGKNTSGGMTSPAGGYDTSISGMYDSGQTADPFRGLNLQLAQ